MLVYEFTDGVPGTTVTSNPWDTGRTGVTQQADPTTRLEIYDAIAGALETMGYTRYDRSNLEADADRVDVWHSRGESGDRHVCFATVMRDGTIVGERYFFIDVGVKLAEGATTLNGGWTWDGTTTVLGTVTSQLRVGSFIRADTDGQWFRVTSITPNVSVVIDDAGFTVPNAGLTASSYRTPTLEGHIGSGLRDIGQNAGEARDRWDLGTTDFSSEFQILGDRDFVWLDFQRQTDGFKFLGAVGQMAPYDSNPNIMFLGADVTPGDFVELQTEDGQGNSVNPFALGFRILDAVQIIEVAFDGTTSVETQPIIAIGASSVTVRRLRGSYTGDQPGTNPRVYGALIGMTPSPIVRILLNNTELEQSSSANDTNGLTTPYESVGGMIDRLNFNPNGDLIFGDHESGEQDAYELAYAVGDSWTDDGGSQYGSGATGNNRTLRFTLRGIAVNQRGTLTSQNVNGTHFLGKLPRLAAFNGTANLYPHDNMVRDRITPVEDYVPFRFESASTRRYVLGPTPGA